MKNKIKNKIFIRLNFELLKIFFYAFSFYLITVLIFFLKGIPLQYIIMDLAQYYNASIGLGILSKYLFIYLVIGIKFLFIYLFFKRKKTSRRQRENTKKNDLFQKKKLSV